MNGVPALPLRFAPPAGGGVDVLIIAGEHSGDEHAARMAAQLRAGRPDARVCALGGPRNQGKVAPVRYSSVCLYPPASYASHYESSRFLGLPGCHGHNRRTA